MALAFAHPDETKARAKKSYKATGSIRKAAADSGVPKSTIHRWVNTHNWNDPLTADKNDPGPSEPVDSEEPSNTPPTPTAGEQDDIAARQAEQRSNTGTELDPEGNEPTPYDPSADGSPPGDLEELDQVAGENKTMPHRLYLQAIYRYISLLGSGVHPDRALDATKSIDPSFYVNPDDHDRIVQGLHASGFDPTALKDYMPSEMMASELALLRFASPDPPGYVQKLADKYSMDDQAQQDMADAIFNTRQGSYLFGINQQLTKLGLPNEHTITDPAVLQAQRDAADASAAQITETWNRDVASRAGAAWIDNVGNSQVIRQIGDSGLGSVGTETRANIENGVDQDLQNWGQGRVGWKGDQIAGAEGSDAYTAGVQDFLDNNPDLTGTVSVIPDDCSCTGCQDLVDLGEISISDAQDADLFDVLPLHPNCIHDLSVNYDQAAADTPDVWSGQDQSSQDTSGDNNGDQQDDSAAS